MSNDVIDKIAKRGGIAVSSIKTAFQNLLKGNIDTDNVVVNILSNTGIAGFKFHIPKEEQIKFQSDVTDHYIDTNDPVQDHVAQKPVIINLRGFQGDYFYSVHKIQDLLSNVTPTIALVKEFIPKLAPITKQILAKKAASHGTVQSKNAKLPPATTSTKSILQDGTQNFNCIDLFSIFQSLYKLKSKQTRAYLFLKALWKSKATFSVETTWERFDDMLITELTPIRDQSLDITDFSVTFKQINTTSSTYRSLENAAGRVREQLSRVQNLGVDKGQKTEVD